MKISHDNETTHKSRIPKSGCGNITEEQLRAIAKDQFCNLKLSDDEKWFYKGFLAGIGFVCVPEDAETYDITAIDFCENAFYGSLSEAVTERIADAFSDILEEFGIEGKVGTISEKKLIEILAGGDD